MAFVYFYVLASYNKLHAHIPYDKFSLEYDKLMHNFNLIYSIYGYDWFVLLVELSKIISIYMLSQKFNPLAQSQNLEFSSFNGLTARLLV